MIRYMVASRSGAGMSQMAVHRSAAALMMPRTVCDALERGSRDEAQLPEPDHLPPSQFLPPVDLGLRQQHPHTLLKQGLHEQQLALDMNPSASM